MGDRGNVVFKYEDGNKIYFYSHWGGSGLKETVRKALIRAKGEDGVVGSSSGNNGRWEDESYLARIVFCQMLKEEGASFEDLTGFGIAPYEVDNEHPLVVVDTKAQTVNGIPFADYVKNPIPEDEYA